MNWEELMDMESHADNLWLPLLNLLRQGGDTFTYKEVAELWDREKTNIYSKIEGWRGLAPGLIEVDETKTPYELHFNWDGLPYAEPPGETEVSNRSGFVTQRTVDSIKDVLKSHNVLEREHDLEFERGNKWDANSQRGQLITYITKDGIRLVRAIALYDNGFIVSKVRIQTAKEEWN